MQRKYTVNHLFFDELNPMSAYVLGFFFADGTLCKDRKAIDFTQTDLQYLQDISFVMDCDSPIYTIDSKGTVYRMRIHSTCIHQYMSELIHVIPKSHTIRFPDIADKLRPHFVRGFFDGDGYIGIEGTTNQQGKKYPPKYLRIGITSNQFFLEDIERFAGIKCSVRPRKSDRSFNLRYNGRNAIAFCKYIYVDLNRSLYLKRKYNIWLKGQQLYRRS